MRNVSSTLKITNFNMVDVIYNRKWEALCNGTAVCGCDYCDEGYSPVCSRTGNTYHNLCKLGCV